jgi:hypothetical protein
VALRLAGLGEEWRALQNKNYIITKIKIKRKDFFTIIFYFTFLLSLLFIFYYCFVPRSVAMGVPLLLPSADAPRPLPNGKWKIRWVKMETKMEMEYKIGKWKIRWKIRCDKIENKLVKKRRCTKCNVAFKRSSTNTIHPILCFETTEILFL